MAKKSSFREEGPQPWPIGMAVRRLKEAGDEISGLDGLNHRDLKFQAWRENISQLFQRNWPHERLPYFSESRIRMMGEPPVTGRDVAIYKEGLAKTKAQIDPHPPRRAGTSRGHS